MFDISTAFPTHRRDWFIYAFQFVITPENQDSRNLLHDFFSEAPKLKVHIFQTAYRLPPTAYRKLLTVRKFQVPGSRFRVPGSGFRVPGSRFQVPGSRFQVPGSRFQVPGSGFQVPCQLPFAFCQLKQKVHIFQTASCLLATGCWLQPTANCLPGYRQTPMLGVFTWIF